VLKRADIKSFHARGLCIATFPLPVIVFGNEAPAAQAFTLAHEFAHVLLKRSGIIGGFARAPEAPNWAVERWCNAFAASFLMPADQLVQMIGAPPKRPQPEISDEQLSAIANRFGVSAHAMLIRLTHVGFVDQAFYWEVKKQEFDQIDDEYKCFGRSSYYGSRYKSAVGNMYTSLVLEAWAAGRITNHNASEYMGIKNFAHLYDIRDNFFQT